MKYELTLESKVVDNITLYRIRALKDFSTIKKGDLGGWVEKEGNLSQEGDCWVYDNAMVYGDARVSGDARVFSNTQVYGNAWVSGDARVYDNAQIYEGARVYGDAWISGNARVYGSAHVCGKASISGTARVYGDVTINKGSMTEPTESIIAPVNLKVPEEVIIRPKTISAIHWLDVCTE